MKPANSGWLAGQKQRLTTDGMWLSEWDYSSPHATGRSAGTAKNTGIDQGLAEFFSMELPIYLKGNAWRAKKSGLVNIGNAVALQFRLRCKNISEVRILNLQSNSGRESGEYTTIHAPASLDADESWSSVCIMPVKFINKGEDRSHSLTIYAATNRTLEEPQSTKKHARVEAKVEIEIGDFCLL